MFQSLIGFKINWNENAIESIGKDQKFQSLIGFKINWNLDHGGWWCSGIDLMFQSLIGFKINWNMVSTNQTALFSVSIPNRV